MLDQLDCKLYPAVQTVYNLYFHPLSKFPGPKLWTASRMPFIYCLLTAKLIDRERQFHAKYGEVVHLAPDEVSFANEQARYDIYSFRLDRKRARKDKVYYIGKSSPLRPEVSLMLVDDHTDAANTQ